MEGHNPTNSKALWGGSWNIYAIHNGKYKLYAKKVGAFRAARLIKEIEAKGFKAEGIHVANDKRNEEK